MNFTKFFIILTVIAPALAYADWVKILKPNPLICRGYSGVLIQVTVRTSVNGANQTSGAIVVNVGDASPRRFTSAAMRIGSEGTVYAQQVASNGYNIYLSGSEVQVLANDVEQNKIRKTEYTEIKGLVSVPVSNIQNLPVVCVGRFDRY